MPDLQPGRMLSHYRLIEKLGEGGMGVVWKAFDTRLNRHIAIKLLRPELTAAPERQRRFMREARVAAAVSHPNIVTVHEVDELDGSFFLCMELVEGRTLRSAIGGSPPLSLTEILKIASRIAEGLARAHREGIVHRDLKPENVILDSDGHPKILDFGLAKLVESQQEELRRSLSQDGTRSIELSRPGVIMGTAAYMSPEQIRGDSVDSRSDIFSFGVLLYELVTGRCPFHGSSQIATLAAILQDPVPPMDRFNVNLPPRLDEILRKCLDKDPGSRYQTSEDLAVDLRRLLRDLESVGRPEHPAGGARPTGKRPSIAVLPFQFLSTDATHSYFAGGLHDELLTQLAKVAGLKVISRTSMLGYQGTVKPMKVIGQELGVTSIVEGSVQVIANRLRVNVQLIDAATDEHIWAERYDRTLDDAFAIQSDMAQQVVTAIGAALRADEQQAIVAAPTQNPEAYQLYLQGEAYRQRPGYLQDNLEAAERCFERALLLDPKFALAHAALSETHGNLYFFGYDPSPGRAARQRKEAEEALHLAPELPRAHTAMGRAHYWIEQDYGSALRELEFALRGMPNDADLWMIIGAVHRRVGDWDAVRSAYEKATQLNPRSADVFGDLGGNTFMFLRRYAEAAQALDRAIALASDTDSRVLDKAWLSILWKGDLELLRSSVQRLAPEEDLGGLGTARRSHAELLLFQRKPEALLALISGAPTPVFKGQLFYTPVSLYSAWAQELDGNDTAAREAYDAALEFLDSSIADRSESWPVHDSRGLVLACLGRTGEALREVEWLRATKVYRIDAFGGPDVAGRCALILGRAGETGQALDELERVLAGPGPLSVPLLRLDPRWDFIREHPRFRDLLEKYANAELPRG